MTSELEAAAEVARLAERLRADGEFRLAARFWTGTLRFDVGVAAFEIVLDDGAITDVRSPVGPLPTGPGHLGYTGPDEVWRVVLSPVPPPFHHDLAPARFIGIMQEGEEETSWQYWAAARRVVDLMREEWGVPMKDQ